ncbi:MULTISPECIES: DUF6518 family protein [unclassified Streptomyces]|uniref:DUF6518 family protein n=1 Tax=unclassified Streptomyces TaxID=2593676 RepID=UPI002E808F9F|nr:DUF6518 family protein [Streptomyces sp. NBC_00523]WUD03171.1 DUF6518 family protein [Streptomyces sp. NBC_00523]
MTSPPSTSVSTSPHTLGRPATVTPVLCAATGIALGVLTNLLQGWLPWPWSQLANSGGVWSVLAFATGAVLAARVGDVRRIAAAGALAEIGLVVGYYGYAELGRGGMGSLTFPLVWLVMACVAGPLFGAAGAWSRRSPRLWRRVASLGAVGGLFGSESLHSWLTLGYADQAIACAVAACALPLALARTWRERGLGLAVTALASPVAYAAVYGLLDQISG